MSAHHPWPEERDEDDDILEDLEEGIDVHLQAALDNATSPEARTHIREALQNRAGIDFIRTAKRGRRR